jgi:hypothetical protein
MSKFNIGDIIEPISVRPVDSLHLIFHKSQCTYSVVILLNRDYADAVGLVRTHSSKWIESHFQCANLK